MKLLRKVAEKRKQRKQRQYAIGYDWAAGGLLRGDITPADVDAYTFGSENEPFDRGAIDALAAISRLKRIEAKS